MSKLLERGVFTGERALFASRDVTIRDSIFKEGESPLKESHDLEVEGCIFKWKYPLWYCSNVKVRNTTWAEDARAGVWYTDNITVTDSAIEAPKNFRRCNGLTLERVSFANAAETLWKCQDVTISDMTAKGDYLAMDCRNLKIADLTLYGNYPFDGAEDVEIKDSRLLSKDAFWNSTNVTVRSSFISGEYLGWNAKNLTLVDCTIESLQGLCYIDNLVMRNCKLIDTTLAFEYSSVDAEIESGIESVINPKSGRIKAESIGTLILEKDRIDPTKTKIIVKSGNGVCA